MILPYANSGTSGTDEVLRLLSPAEAIPVAGLSGGVATLMVEEMVAAWGRGQRVLAEEYLARKPELRADAEAAIRLIYEEVCLRRGEGQDVSLSELVRRFPQWGTELEILLECDRLLDSRPKALPFPLVGENLGDFQLLDELGRGTRGRCFLAAQPSLANRLVVLKVTSCDHVEHLSLACLQHTHIVPLYSEQEFPEINLRAMCMPYLGGATLGQVLALLGEVPPDRRTGQSLLNALDRIQAVRPMVSSASPTRRFLARTTYVRAICWAGACLADALQYAHERGIVHMDVKPSNVLLAADGQPLLLDFHLARAPLRAGEEQSEWVGGTPAYMSPEQYAAITAVSEGRAVPNDVDARTDLYALGRTLCEALGGTVRDATVLFPRQVTTSLGDVIRKCLAFDPSDRYTDAVALANDLRRHMADLPLQGVANRNLSERWLKWCRRSPSALLRLKTVVVGSTLLIAVIAAVWAVFLIPRFHAAEQALGDGKSLLSRRDYSEAARVLARGAALIEGLPGGRVLTREIAGQARRVNCARNADLLHDLVEKLRFLDSTAPLPLRETKAVEQHCQTLWETRQMILEGLDGTLGAEDEARLRSDMLDLAVIGTSLRVRLAVDADDSTKARREALRVLDEAEARFGPSHILFCERQAHAQALGQADTAAQAARSATLVPPRTAGEHYAMGRYLLASGDLEAAEAAFERALALRPEDFWSNFKLGVCAYRRQHFEDAVDAFRVCIALAPDRAEPFFNRARAQTALGHTIQASRDYARALKLNPTLVVPRIDHASSDPRTGRKLESSMD
ncbi:Serine/threonine protein kinase [Singulisphaera sp. GP187]|uniref:serine/threonine-protein kinase n=1 Tax=Singulisphaera sp. GP187 TaxID=1882752 RepID=UPI000927D687|nr:serine/threonine-protein kinase [Singulisphaera sp. GP187]SIO61838.1 Serine/threonine protein kinase [Singulisphaera sp. GP187]